MTGYLQEILGISGIMLVKAFGREDAERQRFAAMNVGQRGRVAPASADVADAAQWVSWSEWWSSAAPGAGSLRWPGS